MTARAGIRPLVAQTCTDCGELRDASLFRRNGRGYYHRQCYRCSTRRRRASADEARRAAESHAHNRRLRGLARDTRENAAKHRQDWTLEELETALSATDVVAAARRLGRTYDAVVKMRSRNRLDT